MAAKRPFRSQICHNRYPLTWPTSLDSSTRHGSQSSTPSFDITTRRHLFDPRTLVRRTRSRSDSEGASYGENPYFYELRRGETRRMSVEDKRPYMRGGKFQTVRFDTSWLNISLHLRACRSRHIRTRTLYSISTAIPYFRRISVQTNVFWSGRALRGSDRGCQVGQDQSSRTQPGRQLADPQVRGAHLRCCCHVYRVARAEWG